MAKCCSNALTATIVEGYDTTVAQGQLKFTLALLLTLAMYGFTCFVLGLEEIIEGFAAAMWLNAVFFVMMALTVLIFDVLLSRLELVWEYRLRPRLLSKGGDK